MALQRAPAKVVVRRSFAGRFRPIADLRAASLETGMGKRSGVADTETDLAKLSLEQINADIARCLYWSVNGGSSQGRKSFFKRLVWLEAERQRLHDIPAPKRRF